VHEDRPVSDLCDAITAGDASAVRRLLQADPRLASLKLDHDLGPLHLAAEHDRADIAEILIAAGAPVNPRSVWSRPPLHRAVIRGSRAVADVLLGHGAPLDLWSAAGLGRLDAVQTFWNAPSPPAIRAVSDALYIASRTGQSAIVDWLLAHGAQVNFAALFGAAPLHWALAYGHGEIARHLLDAGADPDLRDDEFRAPPRAFAICLAAADGRAEVVAWLLGLDASLANCRCDWGTPLHEAAFHGRVAVAEILLAAGADPHALNKEGRTPHQIAASRGRTDVISLFPGRPTSPLSQYPGRWQR
jgi:ankyrin repeat protein